MSSIMNKPCVRRHWCTVHSPFLRRGTAKATYRVHSCSTPLYIHQYIHLLYIESYIVRRALVNLITRPKPYSTRRFPATRALCKFYIFNTVPSDVPSSQVSGFSLRYPAISTTPSLIFIPLCARGSHMTSRIHTATLHHRHRVRPSYRS